MIIETKYSIGETVLLPHAPWIKEERTCPDCLGTMKWVVPLPSGEITEITCRTCEFGKVKVWRYRPEICEERVTGMYLERGSNGNSTAYQLGGYGHVDEDKIFTPDQRREAHVKAINLVIEARKSFARNAIERSTKGKVKLAKLLDEHNAKDNLAWIEKEDLAAYVNDWKASNGK